MKLCLLNSLVILSSLIGTPIAQDESLKRFASVWAGEYMAMNESNPIDKIDIYYRDIPLLDPCDSITLIMEEFHGETRERISYLLLTREMEELHIVPRNFSGEWLARNNGHLAQEHLNFVKPSDVSAANPLCTRKFKTENCPPYTGAYPGCTLNDQNPTILTTVVSCYGVEIIIPKNKASFVYKRVHKNVPKMDHMRPRMDPCP